MADFPALAEAEAVAEHLDVLIVGAGLSGVGAACHLNQRCPGMRYAILEARATSGGTWDLFRYPGIRSDSDMFTLGYSFSPWTQDKSIADGAAILEYIRDTARDHGVEQAIRYGHRVRSAAWSSADAKWLVQAETADGRMLQLSCGFLLMCSGYYSYAGGHAPEFPGMAEFAGQIIHPQFWPEQLDYAGKRVVVIGSGATAVTVVPAMAKTASHVTMLQRSPTYVVARPSADKAADWLRKRLPPRLAHRLARWKNVALTIYFYRLTRKHPEKTKQQILAMARSFLGPDYDVATHFTPSYKPWDQRLCLIPDADLFKALRQGQASVVTGTIKRFTAGGIELDSGEALAADIVVMATGLKLNLLGDVAFSVDGAKVEFSKTMAYKGMMFSGVPNLASVLGYTNASWTLKAEISCKYVCRLLNHMKRRGYAAATPLHDPAMPDSPLLDLSSGYVLRGLDMLPRQGSKRPWRMFSNYVMDTVALRFGRLSDGTMKFTRRDGRSRLAQATAPRVVETVE